MVLVRLTPPPHRQITPLRLNLRKLSVSKFCAAQRSSVTGAPAQAALSM